MASNYMVIKNGLIVQGVASASFAYTTASWAVSASWAPSNGSGQVDQATNATQSIFATQSLFATQSIQATQSLFAVSASWASSSLSASWITASGVVGVVTSASYAISASNLSGFSFGSVVTTITNKLTASVVLTVSTASYIAAFFDYAAVSSSNIRAGTVFGSWLTNGSITYTEVTNVDVGNTQDVTMSIGVGSSGTVQLSASSVTFANWTIRALGRFI